MEECTEPSGGNEGFESRTPATPRCFLLSRLSGPSPVRLGMGMGEDIMRISSSRKRSSRFFDFLLDVRRVGALYSAVLRFERKVSGR